MISNLLLSLLFTSSPLMDSEDLQPKILLSEWRTQAVIKMHTILIDIIVVVNFRRVDAIKERPPLG